MGVFWWGRVLGLGLSLGLGVLVGRGCARSYDGRRTAR